MNGLMKMNKKINPRFLAMAERQMNPNFLEEETRKAEEAKRAIEEHNRLTEEEVINRRMQKLEELKVDEERKRDLSDYVEKLNNFEGENFKTSIYAFVEHPDFSTIYNQLKTIPTISDKWAFLVRRAYEIGNEVEIPIGSFFQDSHVNTKRKLEDYGIYFLCPYFKESENPTTREECVIDGEPIMSLCHGLYEMCGIFRDRSNKAAAGEIKLPEIKRTKPKVEIPKVEVQPVDLQDLGDWWEGEGKYG